MMVDYNCSAPIIATSYKGPPNIIYTKKEKKERKTK